MPGPPDSSFRTAGTHGYDVYVWNCVDGQRTVIYKYTAEMTCADPEMVTGPCGEITGFESSLKGMNVVPVPYNLRWPE